MGKIVICSRCRTTWWESDDKKDSVSLCKKCKYVEDDKRRNPKDYEMDDYGGDIYPC